MSLTGSYLTIRPGILLCIIYLMLPVSLYAAAQSPNSSVEIFPPDFKPFNLSYGNWTAKWWQWANSRPLDKTPFDDTTGDRCGSSQNDPNVWFLAGTMGGDAERTCEIPSGKSVMFTVINVFCSYSDDKFAKNEADLRECAKTDQDAVNVLNASIDGKPIENLKHFRMQSPLFNITVPQNNAFGSAPGTTQAISDGWFVITKPLAPGKHQIKTVGGIIDPTFSGNTNFATSTRFNIIVK